MKKNLKKVLLIFLLVMSSFILISCKKPKDITNFITVKFEGKDTRGTASYDIDVDGVYKEVLGISDLAKANAEQLKGVDHLMTAFNVKLSKDKELSNGEEISVDVVVKDDKDKLVKSGKKTVKVSGLEELKELKTEDAEKHLVVNFNGSNGRGKAKIDNTLPDELKNLRFKIDNDGKLKNGDKVELKLDETWEESLIDAGYKLAKDFKPVFEVKGLENVPEKISEISNFDDIVRMLDEGIKRKYKNFLSTRYEIKEEQFLYRQFNKNDTNDDKSFFSSDNDKGRVLKIYTVKEYLGKENELLRTFTAIYGFGNIILDENNKVNVADLKEIWESKDDTYSTESVLKLYEGYGYEPVDGKGSTEKK